MNKNFSYERYSRQMQLKEFGETGQEKLLQAKVLVIGAGGLGCPALQYLAAAGTGTIGIMDDDEVSLSNLHRQPLYLTGDVGFLKAETAAKHLRRLNPEIKIIAYNERLTRANALDILPLYDIIIDASDNFATRYLVNDACVLLNKPLIYGAVSQFEGQVAVFNCSSSPGLPAINYRDLFPQPLKENEILNCAQAGVLGVLPGIIGIMQAAETIKLITGIGEPLINKLLTYNILNNQSYEIALSPGKDTHLLVPSTTDAFKATNYELLCASAVTAFEIDNAVFDQLIDQDNVLFIDVREKGEMPAVTEFSHEQIPLSQLSKASVEEGIDTIVVFCQSGKRSAEAAKYFSSLEGMPVNIFSLKKGIVQWKQHHQQEIV